MFREGWKPVELLSLKLADMFDNAGLNDPSGHEDGTFDAENAAAGSARNT